MSGEDRILERYRDLRFRSVCPYCGHENTLVFGWVRRAHSYLCTGCGESVGVPVSRVTAAMLDVHRALSALKSAARNLD